jgi:hypothetical protein
MDFDLSHDRASSAHVQRIEEKKEDTAMTWRIEEALDFCQTVESAVVPAGFHVGLRGGVLLRGSSDHDLDLVIYPHDSTRANFAKLREALHSIGMFQLESVEVTHARWRSRGCSDEKMIELWELGKRKIDILFVGAQ